MFRGHCDAIARRFAVVLAEEDDAVYIIGESGRTLLHRAVDPSHLWFETWRILHDDPSRLRP